VYGQPWHQMDSADGSNCRRLREIRTARPAVLLAICLRNAIITEVWAGYVFPDEAQLEPSVAPSFQNKEHFQEGPP
jgi:hypothetical protein